MTKTYNTPKRTHIVKTRLDDEELNMPAKNYTLTVSRPTP